KSSPQGHNQLVHITCVSTLARVTAQVAQFVHYFDLASGTKLMLHALCTMGCKLVPTSSCALHSFWMEHCRSAHLSRANNYEHHVGANVHKLRNRRRGLNGIIGRVPALLKPTTSHQSSLPFHNPPAATCSPALTAISRRWLHPRYRLQVKTGTETDRCPPICGNALDYELPDKGQPSWPHQCSCTLCPQNYCRYPKAAISGPHADSIS